MQTAPTAHSPTEIPDDALEPSATPPYRWALGAGLAVFVLYALTLARTTAFWDTSEYIATGHIAGIPHPPGNPTFVVLARTWDILLSPFGLPVAVRINLFSAFMSATAHALWFLVVHHILRFFSDSRTVRLAGAAAAVAVSASAFTVWSQSNVNEKVYTVSLATIALLSWLLFRWQERLGQGKDDNLIVLMVFILALSVGNHLMAFLAAPAMLVFVLLVHPRTLMNWKLYAAAVIAGMLGLTVHLFLPLRAALDPIINEADPTCTTVGSALVSILTWGKAGCVALSEALARRQYEKPALLPRLAPFGSQVINYVQYFDWQWSRSLEGQNVLLALSRLPLTLLFTGLGLWGAVEHARRDRASFWYVLALFGTLSLGLVWYLNFKYGFSIAAPSGGEHEVRERDYFFIVSFSVWGLWAGIGLATVWQQLARRVGSLAMAAPVLAIALIPLALNASWAMRSRDYAARDWGYNLLMSVEPYGILFTNGDNDTFPLWYVQEVEGIRRDVTVIVTSYLNTSWYTKQLRDMTRPCPPGASADQDWTRVICQRPYEANTPAVYTSPGQAPPEGVLAIPLDGPLSVPDKPILDLDDETIDKAVYSYIPMDEARALTLGNVEAILPRGGYLYPWHQFALTALSQSIGTRPIYFASSGNAAVELGVQPYLIRHGLAFKLNNGAVATTAPAGTIQIAESPIRAVTGPAVNVPRTEVLLQKVFVHHSGLPEWDHWPDHSTIGIPNYYAWAYYALAQAAGQGNRQDALRQFSQLGDRWALLGTE
ncbi:MAG: DUF2723 domain-containing protein [Gemmatimonadetes bacterium]|nr:DUF2723 domain-containing protein [Gemmatimonadota bacterium]